MMYEDEGLISNRIIALAILTLFILLILPASLATTSQGLTSRLLEKDDWVISGAEFISDEDVVLTGNLTVDSGGRLTLMDSELVINSSFDQEFLVHVETGGRLDLINTTIKAMTAPNRFVITVLGKLAADNSTIANFTSMRFTDAKATLNHSKLDTTDGTVITATGSDLSLTGCEILISDGEGIKMADTTGRFLSTVVKSTSGSNTIGLNLSASSHLTFTNGGVYDFSTGIRSVSSYVMFDDAVIRDSKVGLRQQEGSVDIIDSRIQDNEIGIECTNGTAYIGYNEISAQVSGIQLSGCNASIERSTVADSGVGIQVNGSKAKVVNNTMRYNAFGLFWSSTSSGEVSRNVFLGNTIGVEVQGSIMRIEDSVFTTNDIGVEVFDGHVDVVNTSIGKKVVDSTSTVSVYWYLDILVKDQGGLPVPEAQVEDAKAALNKIIADLGLTDALLDHHKASEVPLGEIDVPPFDDQISRNNFEHPPAGK